jgi:hypothetical protein
MGYITLLMQLLFAVGVICPGKFEICRIKKEMRQEAGDGYSITFFYRPGCNAKAIILSASLKYEKRSSLPSN